jgi:LysM repeat protein
MRTAPANMTIGIALAAVLSGCASLYTEEDTRMARERTETVNLRQDVVRLQEKVAVVATAQDDLYRQIDRLRAETGNGDPELRKRVDALERSVQALDAARAADRQYIIDDLTPKIAGLAKAMQSPAPAAAQPTEGYEHVVAAGETLSRIASEYKVSPEAIVKANNLKNPNALRVGQKLFIPR